MRWFVGIALLCLVTAWLLGRPEKSVTRLSPDHCRDVGAA